MRKVIGWPNVPAFRDAFQGKTKREAQANIRNAIEGYLHALEEIESDPKFIEMMERTEAGIRAGRVHSQEEVEQRLRQ